MEILEEIFYESALECSGFKKHYILREIPKTSFTDFGLLYENDKGEYVVLNGVRMADNRLASLVTSAVREVKDSRRSGMYQSYNFLTRLGMQSL